MIPTIDPARALGAVRYFRALAVAKDSPEAAPAWVASQGWRGADALLELVQRSGASAVTDDELRGRNPILTDLSGAVRAASLVGQIPGIVRLPFLSATIGLGGAVRANFVRQGVAVPVSPVAFSDPALLDQRTIYSLLIARDQFLREAGPMAERALAEEMIKATAAALDAALVDVTNTGSGDAPASITSTGYSTASTGSTLSAIDTDLRGLVEELSGEDLQSARWILHPRSAAFLAALRGTSGSPAFPGIGVTGGQLLGIPAIVSAGVPMDGSPDETQIALIVGSGIVLAGGEGIELRLSRDATLEMATDPTGNAEVPTAQSKQMVSMFQADCTAMLTILHANWRPRRSTVAATLTAVGY